ncbi:hypothetical protein [Actinacidiphila soli]|nr:hypothetical protein [Actinacidiphila soli]
MARPLHVRNGLPAHSNAPSADTRLITLPPTAYTGFTNGDSPDAPFDV